VIAPLTVGLLLEGGLDALGEGSGGRLLDVLDRGLDLLPKTGFSQDTAIVSGRSLTVQPLV
jgi:hypothetical protein